MKNLHQQRWLITHGIAKTTQNTLEAIINERKISRPKELFIALQEDDYFEDLKVVP